MTPSTTSFFIIVSFLLLTCDAKKSCHFNSIYQFGDSILDTGNLIRINPQAPASHLPYGQTYFHKPTGRFSNGLLMIDFISMAFKLPLLNPYLNKNASFNHGVNFAVAGCTCLDSSFFEQRNVSVRSSNVPLKPQLEWFKDHLKSSCHTVTSQVPKSKSASETDTQTAPTCDELLRNALVFVGEIGGNDYNFAFTQGKSIKEVKTYVPFVVNVILNSSREVIGLGATKVTIPGNFPIGCFPRYLTYFNSVDPKEYDEKGCLKRFNEFALYHNNYLKKGISKLKNEFPNVTLLYGDYYSGFQSILHHGPLLGFDQGSLLKACCGIGGLYNYNLARTCGDPGVAACGNPAGYIHWDGVHLTQEAYRHISSTLIKDILQEIKCSL